MRIALISAPTAFPWTPDQPDDLGGGEEAICLLADALYATNEHTVEVFWSQPTIARPADPASFCFGVPFRHYSELQPGAYDLAIFRKIPEPAQRVAPVQVLWTDQAERPFPADAFEHVVVASQFLKRTLAGLVPAAADRITVLPDGYDPTLFPADAERDPHLVLHASSPDRGLLQLLDCWPEVAQARPDARLVITYGWDLYLGCGGDPNLKAEVDARLSVLPRVTMARVSRAEAHRLFATAGVWAYYCTGGEFFCQSAVKAQVGGAVPVVRPWGGMHETVWSGLRGDTPAEFTRALIEALDPERQAALRAAIGSRCVCGANIGFVNGLWRHTIQPNTDCDHEVRLGVPRTWASLAPEWLALATKPVAPLASKLVAVPPTPAGLLPNPMERGAEAAVRQLVQEWMQRTGVTIPFVDPALPLPFPPSPTRDGLVLGWTLEDDPGTPRDLFAKLNPPPGIAILALVSTGTWRAAKRHRAVDRRTLVEWFGRQPECQLRGIGIGPDGNGILSIAFRYDPKALGERDVARVRRLAAPRESLSACFIVRDGESTFLKALRSIAPVADEVCIVDTGSVDRTPDVVEQFRNESGLDVRYVPGTSPRFCYDCLREHAIGELLPGHRLAGFETPRNESIAMARGQWVIWFDADEVVLHPERLGKYLRRGHRFEGFGIPQDHFSSDPPQAYKRDLPVRLFRRTPNPAETPGLAPYGDHQWPTYFTGLTTRFTGIVHEHPGHAPTFTDGLGPVMILGDVWIAHSGYYTEHARRGRFTRNWPLMVADRMKYPQRRLGLFLWLRDLVHQFRYLREQAGGQISPAAAAVAEEGIALYRTHFLDVHDLLGGDALAYASILLDALQRGIEVNISVTARKPEVTGDQQSAVQLVGRVETKEDLLRLLGPRLDEWARWTGEYLVVMLSLGYAAFSCLVS